MTDSTTQSNEETIVKKPDEQQGLDIQGHIKIFDPSTDEVYVDKNNAIHYENFSKALANSIANRTTGFIEEMHFGNGGTSVDATGIITYLTPNSTGDNANLYNQTYYKSVNDQSSLNTDTTRNKITIAHTSGTTYSDVVVSCLLDFGEPSGQSAFDNTTTVNDTFVFDEIALFSWEGTAGAGNLLTHVIFHPVQKSLNRLIQIDYTIRIQSLTNFVDS
jgi:hypothetical protein|tara:strand:+ start:533 stop:1186 length:654 start_codon:yes stop_codon:yes gene_type:complete